MADPLGNQLRSDERLVHSAAWQNLAQIASALMAMKASSGPGIKHRNEFVTFYANLVRALDDALPLVNQLPGRTDACIAWRDLRIR